jgi:hypothetical protein
LLCKYIVSSSSFFSPYSLSFAVCEEKVRARERKQKHWLRIFTCFSAVLVVQMQEEKKEKKK